MAMSEQELVFLNALLSRVPGKTAQQKLNYIQDWAKGINLDLFGTAPEYAPSAPPVTYNKTAAMYAGKGNDALDSIFNSIESGVDPFTAVQQASSKGPLPNAYDPNDPSTKQGIDYIALAQQYAADKFEADRSMADWQAGEQQRQTEFEAKQPARVSDLVRSKYDVLSEAFGKPVTSQDLLNRYQAQRQTQPSPGRSRQAQQNMFSQNAKEEELLRSFVLKKLDERLASSKQQVMPTARGEALMGALPFFTMGA